MKLHIPGPISISADTWEAMSAPMIGHRSGDFQQLYKEIHPFAQQLFGTEQTVFLSTSSAWGVMEAALKNLCIAEEDWVLNCCAGAFSDKWHDVALRMGYQADKLSKEWGEPITKEDLTKALSSGKTYRVITLVHSETSTGVLNCLEELTAVVRELAPETLLVVDTVSSASTVPLAMDKWGVDVILTGSQKALALPPGLALFAVSKRALQRAQQVPNRGYYFDFLEFEKNAAKFMTPSTPCIHTLRGLLHQFHKMAAEGWENRFARHKELNAMVANWVVENGFEFFAPEGYRSYALTCIKNKPNLVVAELAAAMKENHQIVIDQGYGKLKGNAFRLSNMGDETPETMTTLLTALSQELANL